MLCAGHTAQASQAARATPAQQQVQVRAKERTEALFDYDWLSGARLQALHKLRARRVHNGGACSGPFVKVPPRVLDVVTCGRRS